MIARQRRTLILGAVTVALAGLVRATPPVAVALRARTARLAETAALVERARMLVAGEPALRDALAARGRSVMALAPVLVAGDTPADGAASLASQITGLAARRRVAIQRLEPGRDSSAGPLVRLELTVRLEGDLAGLAGLVGDIEGGEQLLTVPRLAVTTDGEGDASPQRLHADIAVRGWMLKPRTGGAK